ncbi:hypothetical protein FACS1894217_03330 [Clostridia bacterium]|nr:hypothetical protein FACS1894217_03330 [Clostridia bacterium]
MQSNRKAFNRSDGILILSLLLSAFAVFFVYTNLSKASDPVCDIFVKAELVTTVKLNENKSFSLDELPNVGFEIQNGKIAFVYSDCPDKVCIHSGFLGTPGQAAACLPNRVSIKIRGADGVDAVV